MAEGGGDAQELAQGRNVCPVKYSDMNEPMITEAIQLAKKVTDAYPADYEYAAQIIKKTMDEKFGLYWHAVVGEGYSFEITGDDYLYLYFGGKPAVLIWKCP